MWNQALKISIVLGLAIVPPACYAATEQVPRPHAAARTGAITPAQETPIEAEATTSTPQAGGILKVAVPADPGLWDPKYTEDTNGIRAEQQIYATLMQNTADGKSVVPWLAQSYTASPDLKSFTFHLRQDAKFCDGSPITASDVKFSFDRALEKDSNVTWQYPAGTQVQVVDPYTVKITVQKPLAWFLKALTLWGTDIMSKNYVESQTKAEVAAKPLGSGPYCLKSWNKGSGYVLTKNPYYFGQPSWVNEVDVKVVQDDTARVLQLESGSVDIAIDVPYSQVNVLSRFPGITGHTSQMWGLATIVLNQKDVPAFRDKNVRQAMSYAINRQAIVDAVLVGQGTPALSPWYGVNLPGYTDKYAQRFNLDKAKQLMASSGYPNGFKANLTVVAGDTVAMETAVILKDELSKIGIDVNITPVEEGSWFSKWSSYDYQMLYKLGTELVADQRQTIPFDYLTVADGGQGTAFTGWSDPSVTKVAQAALLEQNPAKLNALYDQLQQLVMDQDPQLVLFLPFSRWGEKNNVHGFAIGPTSLYRFWDVWLSQ